MSQKRFPNDHLLVSTQWVVDHLDDPDLRLVEVSAPGGGYRFGHPPGAVYLNLDEVMTGGDGKTSHMVGPLEQVAATLGRLGIIPDNRIVVYDETSGTRAAKTFWLLEYLGFPRVHVLEGGVERWMAENPKPGSSPTSNPALSSQPCKQTGWPLRTGSPPTWSPARYEFSIAVRLKNTPRATSPALKTAPGNGV
ncbi:MAG: hypothetical protein HYR94_09995 [Chloroflexi bacterium]|nr:hypothetical protein [Chloroflexota bacterium]